MGRKHDPSLTFRIQNTDQIPHFILTDLVCRMFHIGFHNLLHRFLIAGYRNLVQYLI